MFYEGLMERYFHEEIKELKQKVLKMGFLVETALEKAAQALLNRRTGMIDEVLEGEKTINDFEIRIDEEGHNLIALMQPMAADLRLLIAILKINTDLERIGDHAVNIVERVGQSLGDVFVQNDFHLSEMVKTVQDMLASTLDSFMNEDVELAQSVLNRDDEVDAYNDQLYSQLEILMQSNKLMVKAGTNLIMIGHNLERIADLANNISEDVIYLKLGKEVRHHSTENAEAN